MGLAPGSSCCGEQQRLAVAAAVANEPPLLLADEPTSQLDRANVTRVLALLRELRDLTGTTVLRGAPPGARALVEVGDGPVLLHPVDPPDEAPP